MNGNADCFSRFQGCYPVRMGTLGLERKSEILQESPNQAYGSCLKEMALPVHIALSVNKFLALKRILVLG